MGFDFITPVKRLCLAECPYGLRYSPKRKNATGPPLTNTHRALASPSLVPYSDAAPAAIVYRGPVGTGS